MWNSKLARVGATEEQPEPTPNRATSGLVIPKHNLILASLPHVEANKVISASKAIQLNAGDVIYEGGEEIDYVYFPVNAVIAALALLEDGSTVEISMTGREGLAGIPALIGGRKAMHWTRISVGGAALRATPRTLLDLFLKSEEIHQSILRAYRNLFTQICQRSVCNVRHTLLQRLCVWLLMINDRVGRHELPFTQEEIANRISVRRAGISVAASMLQAMQAITYHRGKIVITDRAAIEQAACECYKILAHEFDDERA
jgi:CRP-like cAMP-binding protein